MKYAAAILGLIGLSTAVALPADDPERILPPNWTFEIEHLKGPGCPDQGNEGSDGRITRPTYGSNTVDGSEIYYWFIAYPWMRVDLAEGPSHTWCEATIKYTEYKDTEKTEEGEDYRLRLHKNGTRGIMTYDLDAGCRCTGTLPTRLPTTKMYIVDTITLTGPLQSPQQHSKEHSSDVSYPPELIPQPECGSGTFSFHTELWVKGGEGQTGIVASETVYSKDTVGVQYYGTQQGFSYDWEKCAS
ncbi:hypothetical protein BDW02DRAFT_588534 [Decorospora gaudefroyi]|uniref:Ubiquitin 3 binding protein But2 C-terminal domain-containing protein n=1 Tax=Decorospora gaudefroyi TaxID=184978 RepID=A0A6A5KC04_9PLEO|nr:hypothetical protein BDW02DRAFT_588534 [Decorospora gaudefroyi]